MREKWKALYGRVSFLAKIFTIITGGIAVMALMLSGINWIFAQNILRTRITNLEYQAIIRKSADSLIFSKLVENDNFHWRQHYIDSSLLDGQDEIKRALGIKPKKNRSSFNQLIQKSPSK